MLNIKCSLPQNENFIKSAARLIVQCRFLIIWLVLKSIRWVWPNKKDLYEKDYNFIELANKLCKKQISDTLHDSYLNYVQGIDAKQGVFEALTPQGWWKGKSVLEIGSGLGQSSHYISKEGAKSVVGIEYSLEKANWSKSHFLSSSGNLDFIQGNAEDLHFPDNEFDYIFSNSVLEHVSDPKRALQEIYRTLKPGGELLLSIDYFHGPGGNHLYDYIYFPWATTLVNENSLCRYWSDKIERDQKMGKMGFYPKGLKIESLQEGLEIQLNKWDSDEMEKAMLEIGWVIAKKVPSFYIGMLPIIRSTKRLKFYLQGAGYYRLIK